MKNLHYKTQVLPGHLIQITDPALSEGEWVEVIVQNGEAKPGAIQEIDRERQTSSGEEDQGQHGKNWDKFMDYLNRLPLGPRQFHGKEEIDRYLEEERNSWDD